MSTQRMRLDNRVDSGWFKDIPAQEGDSRLLVDMTTEELDDFFDNLIRLVLHDGVSH